nr:gustatory receptor 35.2 [Papilio dardanus]
MKIMKPLRFLFILGNFLLLFRNLSFKSRCTRFIIYCLISIDIIITISNSAVSLYFEIYKHNRIANILQVNATLLNSITLLLLSIYHSETFKSLLIVLNSNGDFMKKDEMYLKNLEKKRIIFLLVLILYVGVKVVPSWVFPKYVVYAKDLSFFVNFIFKTNAILWDARLFYEYIFMCTLLYIISEQLECIIRSVVRQKRSVSAMFRVADTSPQQLECNRYIKEISEWSDVFSNIEEAIKLFNRIFRIQFSIMISLTIFYVTLFLYEMTDHAVHSQLSTIAILKFFSRHIIFHSQIFVLSRAGQRLQNNIEQLKRRVGKIYILSLLDDDFYKAAQNFLGHISSGYTRIQAFGPIDVNMSLAPTFIMLYTSYTILALQFNNVV